MVNGLMDDNNSQLHEALMEEFLSKSNSGSASRVEGKTRVGRSPNMFRNC